MLLVTGIPSEIREASTFDSFDGPITTHPVTIVHNAAELKKDRPFGEFFQLPPSLEPQFRLAMNAKKPISFYVREEAVKGGSKGQWIKRGIREVVVAEQLEMAK